jgi:hypothetical protein
MKKLYKFLGVIAIGAVIVISTLALAGCDTDSVENTDPKKITITGLNGKSGTVEIFISATGNGEVAGGEGTISNNSVTVPLKIVEEQDDDDSEEYGGDWTGTGSHYIVINMGTSGSREAYIYTNGKTFEQLGISSDEDPDLLAKLPKYNIMDATSTIAFSQFQPAPGGDVGGGEAHSYDPTGTWDLTISGQNATITVTGNNWAFDGPGTELDDTGTFTRNGDVATLYSNAWNGATVGTATLTSDTTMILTLVNPSLNTGTYNGTKR